MLVLCLCTLSSHRQAELDKFGAVPVYSRHLGIRGLVVVRPG